jgi:redox-sensing transcriptional repressor
MAKNGRRRQRIPQSVVHRLPKYLMQIRTLREEGLKWISSQKLADALSLTSSTVRQDLSHLAFSGMSKRGYDTAGLEHSLARLLGTTEKSRMVIVGAGNLGRALALRGELDHGFILCGIFDSNPAVIGQKVGSLDVLSMQTLPAVVRRQKVEIGVIAVPATSAQDVAERLIRAGVRGLLNLAYIHLLVPRRVPVVDVRMLTSLQELAYAVKRRRKD